MAGPSQQRGAFAIVTPSASSDDGTLADIPMTEPSAEGAKDDDVLNFDSSHDNAPVDEIAPLGAEVVKALGIVSRLEQLGLDKQEISLPKCIVLGEQSTGKSSVIEAISGIKTPRDTGTCTRVPMFIELQPSAHPRSRWHAEIYLLKQYDLNLDLLNNSPGMEFPGWVPAATTERTLFAETNNPDHLEHYIRCAQRATLSPQEPYTSFLDAAFDYPSVFKTLFSPNVVGIKVTKPGLPPLSFYDLPGIISQAETDEEEYTVPLVERLVTRYISDSEALILVTCALEYDIANSIAAGWARKLKVTDRCIGVLTKPDRLPQGSSSSHLTDVLEGRRFGLGHKYFVVKNLNSDQIKQGLGHQDARQLEREFFSAVTPWSTDLQAYQHRFGTLNLQVYLSTQLGNRILAKLPDIRRQIEERLAVVDEELSHIPDTPIHTATRKVVDLVSDFAAEMRSEMAGDHGFVSWSNIWEETQKMFWDSLLQLKPTMRVVGSLDSGLFLTSLPGCSADDSITIDSDNDTEMSNVPATPSKKRKQPVQTKREPQTPVSKSSPFRTPKHPASRTSRRLFQAPSVSFDDAIKQKKAFDLDEVTHHISQNSTSKVPGQVNPKVREEMMISALQHWEAVVMEFFAVLNDRLKERVQALFDEHFDKWRGSELYTATLAIVMNLLDSNLYEQREILAKDNLKDELEAPHIFHKDLFKTEKATVLERYRQARFNSRFNRSFVAEAEEHNGRTMTPAEKDKVRKDAKIMALIMEEPYAHEIDLIADITTYYTTAARRLHDSVTMRIESKFFRQLRESLREQLVTELGIYDEQQGSYNAQRLLAKSPERLARRQVLLAKRKALLEGLQCFNEHWQQYQAEHGEPAQRDLPPLGSFAFRQA